METEELLPIFLILIKNYRKSKALNTFLIISLVTFIVLTLKRLSKTNFNYIYIDCFLLY